MNKVAVITGGARRIGAETANYLHSKGINIVITYSKSSVAANALKKELNFKRKDSCHIYKAKFNSNINYKKITSDIIRLFGRLDYLINNASKFYPTKINEVTDKAWLDTIDTNIKTPLFLSKYFYNELKKRRGAIINIIDYLGRSCNLQILSQELVVIQTQHQTSPSHLSFLCCVF